MKRTLVILFTLAFLFEIGGTIFIFRAKQYVIRKEIKTKIKQGLAESELIVFTFSQAEIEALEWKHEREFKFGSMMYDIVSRKTDANGNHILYCVSDEQEHELFIKLDDILGKRMSQNMPFHNPFKQLIRIFSTSLPAILQLDIPQIRKIFTFNRSSFVKTAEGFTHILLPPPKLN